MDNVMKKVNERRKMSYRKIILGAVLLIMLVLVAVLVERWLASNKAPTDIKIKKSEIPEGTALFIKVDALDTNIIATKVESGDEYKYSFVFDDCEGCYQQYGKHYSYKINSDKTAIECKKCGHGPAFEEMGFLAEDCCPVMIHPQDFEDKGEYFLFTAEYLEKKQDELEYKRSGKAMVNTK